MKMIFRQGSIKAMWIYTGVFILTAVILVWVMELWDADLRIPFLYSGDSLLGGMIIKGVIDNGWHLRNSFVGVPAGLFMYDFTGADDFHFLIIKLIALFTSDWALAMNLFFLLTFPLTAVCSLYVFKKFNFSYLPSVLGSLLYAFLPYHFFRGEGHLFLAAYYVIPLMVMVILWVVLGEIHFNSSNALERGSRKRRLIWSVVICLVTACSGIYYAFFACIFLLASGIKGFLTRQNRNCFFLSLFLIFIIFIGALINLSPSLIHAYKQGKHPAFANRPLQESEIYGLKVAQLLLPVDGHRISKVAKLKERYNQTAPLNNENRFSSLGIAGSIGFLILIVGLFFRNPAFLKNENEIVEDLSLLNIIGILYATVGGFGSFFAYTIFSQFRGLNRISVFIAFFALFTVVIILDKLHKRYVVSKTSAILFAGAISILIILGVLDQTTKGFVPPYGSIKKDYKNDANLFEKIEASLPVNSMIFQLPNMLFPETPPVHQVDGYNHVRGYLHSKTLRWSYGTIRGREGDFWQRWVTLKPLKDFVESIVLAGFTGIYLDRNGYPDRGTEIEKGLATFLNTPPVVSDDQRLVFFDMRSFAKTFKQNSTFPGLRKLQLSPLHAETNNIRYGIEILREVKNYVNIEGWAHINEKGSENSKICLGLKSDRNSYLINTSLIQRPDVTAFFKTLNLNDSGFSAIVAKEEIETGTYRLGIYIKKDDIEAFQYTDKVLSIQ